MSSIPDPIHPSWCNQDVCTAFDEAHGQHRSAPITFHAPGLQIIATIFRADPGWHVDTFMTMTVAFDGDLATVIPAVAFTLTIGDASRLARFLAGTVEVARGATG